MVTAEYSISGLKHALFHLRENYRDGYLSVPWFSIHILHNNVEILFRSSFSWCLYSCKLYELTLCIYM
jgi:hypothetical protein